MNKVSKGLFNFLGVEKIINLLSEYIQNQAAIIKVEIKSEIYKVMGKLMSHFLLVLFIFATLFFASITLGFFLNQMLDSSYLGFLIVTGIYLVLGLILMAFRKQIVDGVVNSMAEKEEYHIKEGSDEEIE